MSSDSWQQLLVISHPHLFIRSFRGLPFAPAFPTCPDGWREIVVRLVARVASAASGHPVQFTQIAQKYGRLQVYWVAEENLPNAVEAAIEQAIALSEARSACSCAVCGAEARLFSSNGLLLPACPAHAHGGALPTSGKLENVYLVRELLQEDISVIACRRYDRVQDAFVELGVSSGDPVHTKERST